MRTGIAGPGSGSAAVGTSGPVDQATTWGWLLGLSLLLVLSYLNSLWRVMEVWDSAEYSHGWLIPIFAVVMLYMRRQDFESVSTRERWIAVGLLTASMIVRVASSRLVLFTVDNLMFIPSLLAIFMFVGGFKCLKWAAGPILFMVFMLPLPDFVVYRVHKPLQTLATKVSTYALQTMGIDAYRDGNTIQLENQPLGVVDQCSGLRMLTVFMALAVALAMLSDDRPLWERIALFASSIPIALIVNSIRITLTGLAYNANFGTDLIHKVAHDLAGWIMMPMAFGFLWLVSKVLAHVLIDAQEQDKPYLGVGA
ncbi:MAG: exosortase/archaeosortase family protein [Pirellulales bacterium]